MEAIENGNLIGSINGTVVGDAGLVAGKLGLALYTNGVDQYVDFGYQGDTCLGSTSLCARGRITAFWMLPADDSNGYILDTGRYGYDRVAIYVDNFILNVIIRYPGNAWSVTRALPSQPGWLHLVVSWQPCYGIKLYTNGALMARDTVPSTTFTSGGMPRLVLGAANSYIGKYKITLDELRVWDTVMSDEEVLALYNVDVGRNWDVFHYSDVMMGAMASQITSVSSVCSTVYSKK